MSKFDPFGIIKVFCVIHFEKQTGEYTNIENRRQYGLVFCESGKITYKFNGKEYVLERNKAILIPNAASYEHVCNEKGVFPLVEFAAIAYEFDDDSFHVINLKNPDSYFLDLEKLRTMLFFPESQLKAKSLLYDILYRLSREQVVGNSHMKPVIKHIEKNFCDSSLSIASLAEISGLSESHFRKVFHEHFGLSPKQYIQDIRLEKSKSLLKETKMSITQIAEECGFSNVYHFCRTFKGYTKLTPSYYRECNSNINI